MGAAKKKRIQRPKLQPVVSWEVFLERYTSILFASREWAAEVARIAEKSGEEPWVTVPQIARHLATNRPAAYVKTFGTDDPYELKEWRILSILRNAGYLGAWQALGMKAVRGKGVCFAGKRANLKVVK